MHKNDECGLLFIDDTTGRFEDYKDYNNGTSPFLGNTTKEKMNRWWSGRAIPTTRDDITTLINSFVVNSSEEYLAKNLALSISDAYWIKPIDMKISFSQINFWNLKKYKNGKVPYHSDDTYNPNASLGGQMEKCWDLTGTIPVLRKEASKSFGQQAINELFATIIHERQNTNIPFVKYNIESNGSGSIVSLCEAFTNLNTEFVSAYEVVESEKTYNNVSNYDSYISICSKSGIPKERVQEFMDYQTLTDFIISNTDEHLGNFGVLRDANNMNLIDVAPIFDSGNSMFYSDTQDSVYTRLELLERKITSFYDAEEKILKKVKNKNIVNANLLPNKSEVIELYTQYGIPEDKATIISENYELKVQMLKEFQSGKKISVYNEKHNKM